MRRRSIDPLDVLAVLILARLVLGMLASIQLAWATTQSSEQNGIIRAMLDMQSAVSVIGEPPEMSAAFVSVVRGVKNDG